MQTRKIFQFGKFRLDSRLLEYEGRVVPLAPKAIDTLHLLVEAGGAVVDKEELMRRIWPDTFVVESSLARIISLLRKALEEHGGPGPYIETIAKRGYRFVAPLETPVEEKVAAPWHRWAYVAAAALAVAGLGIGWRVHSGSSTPEDATYKIGHHLLRKVTPEEALKGLRWFESATTMNPRSAYALTGLADALLSTRSIGIEEPDAVNRAMAAARRAVELDRRLPHARATLGTCVYAVEWDAELAEQSFRRALELDRNCVPALFQYARFLVKRERYAEARSMIQRAQQLDPVEPILGTQAGIVAYCAKDFATAAREFESVLLREEGDSLAHYYLALTLGFIGRFDEASHHLAKARLRAPVLQSDRAWLEARAGHPETARDLLASRKADVLSGRFSRGSTLLLAATVGDLDEAFEAVDSVIGTRAAGAINMASDPRLEPIRSDDRYAQAIARIRPNRSASSR